MLESKLLFRIKFFFNYLHRGIEFCGKHPFATGLFALLSLLGIVFSIIGFKLDRNDATFTTNQVMVIGKKIDNIDEKIDSSWQETLVLKKRGELKSKPVNLTMLAESVVKKLEESRFLQYKKSIPRLILGRLRNHTESENISMQFLYDVMSEKILNTGLVRIVDKSSKKGDFDIMSNVTLYSSRELDKVTEKNVITYTLVLKIYSPEGEQLGQWSEALNHS